MRVEHQQVMEGKYSPSWKLNQVLYKRFFLSIEMCSVLHPRGRSLPDIWSGGHLHAGSDHPLLLDAARSSQQRHLFDPTGRAAVVLLKHCKQYPFTATHLHGTEQLPQLYLQLCSFNLLAGQTVLQKIYHP